MKNKEITLDMEYLRSVERATVGEHDKDHTRKTQPCTRLGLPQD